MKKSTPWAIGLLLFFLCSMTSLYAQDTAKKTGEKADFKVKKRTVMEKFEPEMILSVEDRVRLKEERLATLKKRRAVIDTLDISNRKRRRLLKELYKTPFSDQWQKAIADIEFEEEY